MVQSSDPNGNGHGDYQPSAEYEQLDPGQWVKFEGDDVEIVYDMDEELGEDDQPNSPN